MLKFIKFFQGYLYVVISGYSPERFLNLCSGRNIVLWDLTPTEDGFAFCISLKAYRQLRPLLKKTGTRIRIKKRHGLPFLLFRYRKHRFFAVGILCAFAVLFLMSRYIWKVEITGNSFYSRQVLTEFLQDSGVGYGAPKRKIDCGEIESLLRNRFDDITWVSARVSGTRLYLAIQERLEGGTDDEVRTEPADLMSDCKGTVVSVTTRRGTPLVEKGDKVKKGSVLVSGAVDIRNDAGEVTDNRLFAADADVLIRTKIPYEDEFSRSYTARRDTGKKKYRIQLIFHDSRLTLGAGVSKGDTWDGVTKLYPLRIGEDFYLPVQVAVSRYEQYEPEQRTLTETDIRDRAKQDLARYVENFEENSIQILGNNVMIDENEETIKVHGDLDVIKKADQYRDIDPAKLQEEKNGSDTTDNGNPD